MCLAYYKVSSFGEGEQEADQYAEEHGEVVAVSDSRRHSLPAFKLGSASGPSKFCHIACHCFCCLCHQLLKLRSVHRSMWNCYIC